MRGETSVSSQAPAALPHHDDRDADQHHGVADHNFLPDFAWAAVGGGAALGACVLLLMLTALWGGSPPSSSYTREFAGGYLVGVLVVLVARSLSARTR
jgi:hypothetical protein